ncbi:hypothetical protein HGA34_00220 [Candidatus Falkowbacteria bacterium]|nr:hypothetical protein [Candidatus Falkowbacteria bacterium]
MGKTSIGFIGQGWIGRNYANDFEKRGYDVVRYSLEQEFSGNGEKIAACDIVFIAVPTPTTPDGFDDSYVSDALKNVGAGSTAVIKSTILPGTTEALQQRYPNVFVMHSPEFLVEKTAAYDAANPTRNIIGIPIENQEYRTRAERVLSVLPKAPFELICSSKEAELIKYGANVFLYIKVIYANLLYDLADKSGCDWEKVRDMVSADPRIGKSHMNPVDDSGRGAGGHCFIKDFEAFARLYQSVVGDVPGMEVLGSIRDKNIDLLLKSQKNLELLKEVYGEKIRESY